MGKIFVVFADLSLPAKISVVTLANLLFSELKLVTDNLPLHNSGSYTNFSYTNFNWTKMQKCSTKPTRTISCKDQPTGTDCGVTLLPGASLENKLFLKRSILRNCLSSFGTCVNLCCTLSTPGSTAPVSCWGIVQWVCSAGVVSTGTFSGREGPQSPWV